MNNFIIIKFGGTSVSTGERWQTIAEVIRQHIANGKHPVVVCSAISQISNQLEVLIDAALRDDYQAALTQIKQRYLQLGKELQIDAEQLLASDFAQLDKLVAGIALLSEASCRVRASIMAFGELMLTRLGAAFLQSQNLDITWLDARDCLTAGHDEFASDAQNYLSANCSAEANPGLQKTVKNISGQAIITQGFIAKNKRGDTVLLGRGGSDSSAAYLAAQLQAQACEIWTDVPGVYTANPHLIPEARLLKHLDYDEAQEAAAMGAKVLHPKCIGPLKKQHIPLYIKYTPDPQRDGTVISLEGDSSGLPIKSILTRKRVMLIEVETMYMWQQVGFLADFFSYFKKHKLSIDLVSTSESTITVSLDHSENLDADRAVDELLAELNQFASAKKIGPCACITIVGRNIRSILHQLGGVFAVFESQQIHMLSQAANDLNLTFVVDEDQGDRLAKKLHVQLIEQNPVSYYLSQSWQEEFGEKPQEVDYWWRQKQAQLVTLAEQHSPQYIYDQSSLQDSVSKLQSCKAINRLFYAMKANSNADILQLFYRLGLGFECVSMGEVNLILTLFPDIDRQRILFTPNFAPKQEYEQAFALKVNVTVDSLYPLEHWSELFANQELLIRIDPGRGMGHHKYVCTGGTDSKFGIPLNKLERVMAAAKQHNMKIVGLHAHSGSGILQADAWQGVLSQLASLLPQFPDVRIINVGGGLGIVERPGQTALQMQEVDRELQLIKSTLPDIELWMEPGRYLVASSGVIIATVTQIKHKADTCYIGIDAGMNSLIRPALYGSYHEIVNLSKLDQPKKIMANIVGPICESGDTLGYSRLMPETQEGDVILIANTGAYGYAMSSSYNQREPARENYLT